VLASSLTLSDQQKGFFWKVLEGRFADLLPLYQRIYPPGSYSPRNYPWNRMALRIRELCEKYGIRDRVPRPIIPGDKRALNKRIVETLADRLHEMELKQEAEAKIWAYRKAAWAIEDLPQNIGLVYRTMGLRGLQSIEGVGERMGRVIEEEISESVNQRVSIK
jgi:hypothetical protein